MSPTELKYFTLIPIFFTIPHSSEATVQNTDLGFGKLYHQSVTVVTASRLKRKGTARNNSGKSAAG